MYTCIIHEYCFRYYSSIGWFRWHCCISCTEKPASMIWNIIYLPNISVAVLSQQMGDSFQQRAALDWNDSIYWRHLDAGDKRGMLVFNGGCDIRNYHTSGNKSMDLSQVHPRWLCDYYFYCEYSDNSLYRQANRILNEWKTFEIAQAIATSIATANGYGEHIKTLSERQITLILKSQYAAQILSIVCLASSKVSYVMFLRSITAAATDRKIALAFIVIISLWGFVSVITVAFQCQPLPTWDYLAGKCYDRVSLLFTNGEEGWYTDSITAIMAEFL